MRLLDARSLELVDVSDDAVPPYAILSHTWGDEEITIQQLRRLRGWSQVRALSPKTPDKNKRSIALKRGFIKVQNAAQLAVSRGLSYIWVDTCCIDKTSSAELSEAINSMYLWYKRSTECYAFLSDVEPATAGEGDSTALLSRLRNSRWFTRGWTLQELIAPKVVLFYANNWTFLGQKDIPVTFTRAISKITDIDEEVLDGRIDPLQLSVSARMAWASHRNTTRLEDTAYSLMGLFQVNMPLLYGEGRRAFTRLQEEIIQHTDDQSLFAWNSFEEAEEDPDALFGMLAQSPAQFRDAGKLQPLPPLPVYASAPSSITNQGLRVQLYLRPVMDSDDMEDDYYAILDCVMRVGDLYQCPAILLRRLSEDQFGRLQTKTQTFVPPPISQFITDYEGYRSIYVRQQPVYYHLPQFRISPLHMEGLSASDGVQYRLLEAFPVHQWNSATMTLKVDYSRKLRAMGVFRFQSVSKTDEKVDVVVGLRRLNAMEWEGWCFQLSGRTSSLELIYHQINEGIEKITSTRIAEVTGKMLRDSLGDDASLVTSAAVEGIQLQGRLYISILVSPTLEIQTGKELAQINQLLRLIVQNDPVLTPTPYESRVRMITEQCCVSSSTGFMHDYMSHLPLLHPVGGRPLPGDNMGTVSGNFMKPIYDFLMTLRQKRSSSEADSAIQVSEELAEALFDGDIARVEQVLNKGPDLGEFTTDYYGLAPLHWAVAGGSIRCVRLLLTNGVDIYGLTKSGLAASHIAALCNTKVWGAFASHFGAETGPGNLTSIRSTPNGDTALHLAAACSPDSEYGASFFKDVMEWGYLHVGLAPRNDYEETPLHRAAASNNVNAIRALAKRSWYCFVDCGDKYGRTALWHAAAAGSCEAIEALIQLDASIDLTDDLGRSPLHAACRSGQAGAVEVLVRHQALLDCKTDVLNLTPMDFAAMFGHVECLQHLINLVPTPLSVVQQNTALHIAASCGRMECVNILCQWDADPFVSMSQYFRVTYPDAFATVIYQGGDARTVASLEGHQEIVTYFDTSETCREFRDRRFPPEMHVQPDTRLPMPVPPGSAPAYQMPPPLPEVPYRRYGPVQSAPSPYAPVQSAPPRYGPAQSAPAAYAPNESAPAAYPPRQSAPAKYAPNQSAPAAYPTNPSGQSPYPSLGSTEYDSKGRYSSVNLPSRLASSSVVYQPPSQSVRLQEMMEQNVPRSQSITYERPTTTYSTEMAPRFSQSSTTIVGRAASTPSYQPPPNPQSPDADSPYKGGTSAPYPQNPYR